MSRTRDDTRTIRAKVTGQVLTLDETLQDTLPALLALLDALPDDSPFLQLDPPQRRQRTLDALKRVLLRESQVQPLLLVFEDLHWIDTETQALLDSLVESLPTARLLLLVNYRPEYQHGWGSKTYYTQLRLDPLPPASADELLAGPAGGRPQPGAAHAAADRAHGGQSLLPGGERAHPGGDRGAGGRAGGLSPGAGAADAFRCQPRCRRCWRRASTGCRRRRSACSRRPRSLARRCPCPCCRPLPSCPRTALHRGLAHLQAAEFLYETRLFPEHDYTFKHALTHEVAYGSLLQERRRVLHARIVEALEALAGDRVAEQVERLAHHALRGEVWDKALAYCRQAGEKAMARSAYREAVAYFEQALRPSRICRSTRDTREQAIDLRLALRSALLPSGRLWAYPGVSARGRGPRRGPRRPASAGTGLALSVTPFLTAWARMTRPSPPPSAPSRSPRPAGMSSCRRWRTSYLGLAYQAQGDYRRAIDCLRQTVASLDGARRHERFGQVILPAVHLPCLPRLVPCRAGHVRRGQCPRGRRAADCRGGGSPREPHDVPLGGSVCCPSAKATCPGRSPCSNGPWASVRTRTSRLYFPWMAAALGAAYTLAGRVADAVPLLTQAMEQTMATEMVGYQALCRLSLGEAQLLAGRLEEAHALAERALALAREHQERGNQAYALRLLGEIAAQREPPEGEQAEAHYQPGPRPGRGTRHAPAPGPLPPRPRHAVCHDRPAGAGPHRAVHRHRRCTAPWT